MSIDKQMEENMLEEYQKRFSACKSPLETGREE
jgi:hypothetical protein